MLLPSSSFLVSLVWQFKLLMCPKKLTDDSPSLIYCGRLVLTDVWLFADIIQCCCNVTQTALCLFPFPGFLWCYNNDQLSQFLRILNTLHIILLGVGGTIYNTHTLKPFKQLGLDSQRIKKLASKLHIHSVNLAAKICPYQTCPFQYCYQLSSGDGFRPSLQPFCSPLVFFLFFCGGAFLRYPAPKWLPFLN